MKENKEAGISQNDSKKAERPERKKRTSVKENKKEASLGSLLLLLRFIPPSK